MTVYYMVTNLIDNKGFSRYEGIYKVKGKWYNVFDVLLSMISDMKLNYCDAYVFSEKYVVENIEKLMDYYRDGGLHKLYAFPKGDDMLRYHYDELFIIVYSIWRHEILLVYNEEKYRSYITFKNVEDGKFDAIEFFCYGIEEFESSEIGIKTFDDLKRFKTLREFHEYLVEVIE